MQTYDKSYSDACEWYQDASAKCFPSFDFLNADRGDLLIRGFWEGSTHIIIDTRETNLDSKFYKNLPPKKALEQKEKDKK